MEQDFRRNCPAAGFEDTLADSRGANDASIVAVFGISADKVRDGVEPFGFPCQDARPHLVALVGSDFAFEGTFDGAQFDCEAIFADAEYAVAVLMAGLINADGEKGA